MDKKFYKISIEGESYSDCIRELTEEQYELIKGIFEECNGGYECGYIQEAPLKYIVYVTLEINDKYHKQPNSVTFKGNNYVSENDKKYTYPIYENLKEYHYFFDSEAEAIKFAEDKANELNCELFKYPCIY